MRLPDVFGRRRIQELEIELIVAEIHTDGWIDDYRILVNCIGVITRQAGAVDKRTLLDVYNSARQKLPVGS